MTIKDRILAFLKEETVSTTAKISKKLGVSRIYAHRILQELRQEGLVLLVGKTRQAAYVLTADKRAMYEAQSAIRHISLRLHNAHLAEDIVFARIERETGIFLDVPENIRKIVQFGFTEMLNNAIDHSGSKKIVVDCRKTDTSISFTVRDFGIGIFNNVRETKKLPGTLEAIQELLKGKTTTMPEKHSGQGVFFTSKAADIFIADGGDKKLTINNLLPDIFISDRATLKGTLVFFAISLKSKKQLVDVFNAFTSDIEGDSEFSKTRVSVKLFQFGKDLLSRSEAKRVVVNLEHFRDVELDFRGVTTVGQAFGDEIFRVWHNSHSNVHLIPINANDNIKLMIRRAGGEV
ncbi:MAG: hypothetical protein RL141_1112 [Candidatus Parcubacteria bacterium]|jgi:biotin operon repressor